MIRFHLPVVPPKSTSQGKRLAMVGGKPMFFKKTEHKQAENDLLTLCKSYIPEKPLEGALYLCVEFTFPWRKSEPKKNRTTGMLPMTTKPDCDNMAKLIGDVLTKLRFYNDDAQISSLYVSKQWGDEVGITITLSPA